MKYYYLLNGELYWANSEMPEYTIDELAFSYQINYQKWRSSLQPCEINDSELFKIANYIADKLSFDDTSNPINVTDLVNDDNGVIIFKHSNEKDEPHICKYCGAITIYDDENCYAKPKQDDELLQDAFLELRYDFLEKFSTGKFDEKDSGMNAAFDFFLPYLKHPKQVDEASEAVELKYTTQEMIDAVNYGFKYATESQNHTGDVPVGNILQWIMYKRNLLEVPKEFKIFKSK